jgi:hypothetical protein
VTFGIFRWAIEIDRGDALQSDGRPDGKSGATSPNPRSRDLKLDVYRPLVDGKPLGERPAIIMVFGGAFHRGSKGTARFEEDGASDSAMGDYCRAFAAAGYVCLSSEYRLVPEDPALPAGLDPSMLVPKAMLNDPVMTSRIDVVRGRMGLPALDDRTRTHVWNTVFAASELWPRPSVSRARRPGSSGAIRPGSQWAGSRQAD